MADFGGIVGLENVKQAIITMLSEIPLNGQAPLFVYYLAAVERKNGLPPATLPVPPSSDSYYGGIDFESWNEGFFPSVIVVTQPVGAPERRGDGTYGQWFESKIGALVQGDDETNAQMRAAHYGIAITAAILEQGALGGIATKTILTGASEIEFLEDPATRTLARSVTTFHSFVDRIVGEYDRPLSWAFDPYATPEPDPEVQTVDVQFTGVEQLT